MPSVSFDRRTFLRRAGLAGAGAALATGLPRPPARADESLAPFVHGVASGDPLADRVMLWTRVTPERDGPLDVDWVVATDLDLTDVVARGTAPTDASRDYTLRVDATGLEPGTVYYYGFEALGRPSITGRTKTAPAGGADNLRLGVVSCSNYAAGFFNAYAILAERDDLDAILHLGDYIYEYGDGEYGSQRDLQPPEEIATLDAYRTRYAHYRLDPDLRRLHQLYPFVVTWDDHESTNDSWFGGAENHGDGDVPGDERDWFARKANAQQAYREWMPIRARDPAIIYRSLPFGDLLDLVMIDTRLEGRAEQVAAALEPTLFEQETNDPDRQMYSAAQRRFLFDALSESSARWRIIGQQVMLMHWNAGGLPELPDGPDTPQLFREGGNALNADAWDGYTAERDRLFQHLTDEGIGNVVVLTGDIHSSWAADLAFDPYDPTTYNPATGEGSLAVEFVTPSITSDNLNEILGGPEGMSAPFEAGIRADNPHIKYVDLDRHGFLVLDVTAERMQSDWWFTETFEEPSTAASCEATWLVRDGENHVTEGDSCVEPEPGRLPAAPPAEPAAEGTGGSDEGADADADESAAAPLPATGGGTAAGVVALGAAGLGAVIRRRHRIAGGDNATPR